MKGCTGTHVEIFLHRRGGVDAQKKLQAELELAGTTAAAEETGSQKAGKMLLLLFLFVFFLFFTTSF